MLSTPMRTLREINFVKVTLLWMLEQVVGLKTRDELIREECHRLAEVMSVILEIGQMTSGRVNSRDKEQPEGIRLSKDNQQEGRGE